MFDKNINLPAPTDFVPLPFEVLAQPNGVAHKIKADGFSWLLKLDREIHAMNIGESIRNCVRNRYG